MGYSPWGRKELDVSERQILFSFMLQHVSALHSVSWLKSILEIVLITLLLHSTISQLNNLVGYLLNISFLSLVFDPTTRLGLQHLSSPVRN